MCSDRVEGDELNLTQEFIAEMLGTRRATVSLAAMVLQNDGLIEYNRGHIKIIDRPGLEAFTCLSGNAGWYVGALKMGSRYGFWSPQLLHDC